MKTLAIFSLSGVLAASLNFLLFTFVYNRIATPFLQEEQRVENADFIMSYVLFGYISIAAISTIVFYFCGKKFIEK